MLANEAPIKWLVLGDSILHGAYHTFGWRDAFELLEERVKWELRRQHDMFLNMAFSGYTSEDVLHNLPSVLAEYRPDITILMVGANDASHETGVELYEKNLREIITVLRSSCNSKIILLTSAPADPDTTVNPLMGKNLPTYVEVMRKTARIMDCPLVDYNQTALAKGAYMIYYKSDYVHPNENGHRLIAAELMKFLGIFDPENSCCCRFFMP